MFERGYFARDYRKVFAALAAGVVFTLLSAGAASAATRDVTPPTITGVSPDRSAADVAPTANVQVNFSETMRRKTVNGYTLRLFASNVRVAATVSCGRPCRTATVNPKQDLKPGTVYQTYVRGGRKGPKDLAGNGLSGATRWSFSTASATVADSTKPTVTLAAPAEGATYSLNQDVKADYSCQDEAGGSGLASCEGTAADGAPVDTSSAGQKSFTVTATDNAGNTTTVTRTYTVGECTILGTNEKDVLEGTEGADVICGLGGNDTLKGLGGDDVLKGGEGYDIASFEDSAQGVSASLADGTAAGEGDDGLLEMESLLGSPYDDTLTGSDRYNRLIGNDGADTLRGMGGSDSLYGWSGQDTLYGGASRDKLRGGTGADELFGEEGDDALNSQDGVSGNDSLDGGAGTDTKTTDATEASIVNFP
jgi:Ca2+-binding RTX toxin-like protein